MAPPPGNQFWKLRTKHGRDKLFETPEILREECETYFEWVDANPWFRKEAIKSGDLAGKTMDVETPRPYTLAGLCIYLNVSESYWRTFRNTEGLGNDFLSVIDWCELVIRTQKFEGAAVGAFNANIIARDLGLKEQTEISGKNIKVEITDE